MSFTALLWITLYIAAVASSFFVNPLFGSLGYLLEYYMRPELKWWGKELPSLRWNLMISVALGATFVLRRTSLCQMLPVPKTALRWLLTLAGVMVFVTLTVAVNLSISWNWMVQWIKMALIFPMLLVGVIRTPAAFDTFIVGHMLGALWWGWDAYTHPKRAQSRLLSIGSGDTLNDNEAAAHLLTVLPFIAIYLLTHRDKRLRLIALIAAPFVINTLILCNSRGAVVGALAALAASFFLIRTGYRLRLVGAGIALAAGVLMLADTQFLTRQQSTTNYEEDGSAQQRLASWRAGFRLIQDRPLGAGGRGFHLLSPIYIPDIVELHGGELRAPHNTWVMVASEWGIVGLMCFVGAYASAFLMTERVKRNSRAQDDGFYYWRAFAIQLALIAYLVAGTFTDRLYAEAGYWMIGLSCALYRIQLTERAAETQTAPVPATAASAQAGFIWPLAGAHPR